MVTITTFPRKLVRGAIISIEYLKFYSRVGRCCGCICGWLTMRNSCGCNCGWLTMRNSFATRCKGRSWGSGFWFTGRKKESTTTSALCSLFSISQRLLWSKTRFYLCFVSSHLIICLFLWSSPDQKHRHVSARSKTWTEVWFDKRERWTKEPLNTQFYSSVLFVTLS